MNFQLQPSVWGSKTCHFSHASKHGINMFFLPCLGSNSLERNNRGFQQVPLPQSQESRGDSAASLLLWSAQPEADLHLAEMRALAFLSSNLRHLHPKMSSDMKPSHLPESQPGSMSQELWGRYRCFASNISKLCHPSARHFKILCWNGYIYVIPMLCMRTSSL